MRTKKEIQENKKQYWKRALINKRKKYLLTCMVIIIAIILIVLIRYDLMRDYVVVWVKRSYCCTRIKSPNG